MNGELARHIVDMVAKLTEPLGYTGWSILTQVGTLDSTAACEAEPEYKRMKLLFDLDKLQTGDEVDEIIVHEMMHPQTWAQWDTAEGIAHMAADMAPEWMREALRTKLLEDIRYSGEDVATQVGFTTIRLLRRLWKAEAEVKELRKKLRALDKAAVSG